MNARHLIAAATIALVGTSSFAVEATQWAPQAGTLSRAEVRADLARAQAAGEIAAVSASYGDTLAALAVARIAAPVVERDVVRAAARTAPLSAGLYIGG